MSQNYLLSKNLCFSYLLVLFVILISGALFAQEIRITGEIYGESDQILLAFATAVAYSPADSSIAGSATKDIDGLFSLSVPAGDYYLVFTYLGYNDLVLPESDYLENTFLKRIELSSSSLVLETAVVEGTKSQMLMKLDKRVFNVGSYLTGAGNSAADILGNVPSVSVDAEGNVSLRWSNGVRILVDGKPSAMISSGNADALRRMQGDIIESVEVITNPSARYEAEGEAGIINIILKKNKKRGVNGSFGLNAGYPENFGGSYSLNFRRNDFNLFSNFGLSYRRSPGGGNNLQRFFDESGQLTDFYNVETIQNRGGIGGNFEIGTDWFINEKTQLTGSLQYRRSKDNNFTEVGYQEFTANGDQVRAELRDVVEDSNNENLQSSLDFKKTYEEEDREWTAVVQYSLDDDLELSDITETATDRNSPLLQKSSNTEFETNLLIQTDYVHPITDSFKIEGGLRGSFRTIRNAFQVQEAPNPSAEFEIVGAFDDELEYQENITAAYVIAGGEWGKFGLQGGLRGEYSDVTAELLKSEVLNTQNYFNLFPSASVTYQLAEMYQLQASYSRRLSRPRFRLLLPFSNFNNPRNNGIGNPTLFPEYSDSYELSLLRYFSKGTLLASVYHRNTTGVITRLILPSDDGTTIRFPVNLGVRNAYGFEFNLNYDVADWWRLNTDFNLFVADFKGEYEGRNYDINVRSWNTRLNSIFDASDRLQLQTTFRFAAPENTPQGRDLEVYSLDLGGALKILDGKADLTLSARDIFNTRVRQNRVRLPQFSSDSDFQWRRVQSVVLGFVYRLNQE